MDITQQRGSINLLARHDTKAQTESVNRFVTQRTRRTAKVAESRNYVIPAGVGVGIGANILEGSTAHNVSLYGTAGTTELHRAKAFLYLCFPLRSLRSFAAFASKSFSLFTVSPTIPYRRGYTPANNSRGFSLLAHRYFRCSGGCRAVSARCRPRPPLTARHPSASGPGRR